MQNQELKDYKLWGRLFIKNMPFAVTLMRAKKILFIVLKIRVIKLESTFVRT
jgi:hypothetical protein